MENRPMRLLFCIFLLLLVTLILTSRGARDTGYKACVNAAGTGWIPCREHS